MNHITLISSCIGISILLSSCSSSTETHPKKVITQPLSHKKGGGLNFHIEQMTHELVSNIEHVKPNSVIAISSFVYLDGDYEDSPLFAKQIQESFTYEIHKLGQPVIEYKATGFIRVTENGDFALSKDFKELKQQHTVNYILLGTLANLSDGVLVNAKLVGVNSHAVVAASQRKLPKRVIDNFKPSKTESSKAKEATVIQLEQRQ